MRRFVGGLLCTTTTGDTVKSGVDVKLLEVDIERFVRRSVVFILSIAYSPVVGSLFCLLERRRSTIVNTAWRLRGSVDASDATCSLATHTRS
jgi:hypothetical protein